MGDLILTQNGVEWKPNADLCPIRKFPVGTEKPEGAIEIFEMPKYNADGKIDPMRYIAGIDPVDDDQAGTTSLTSILILDLYTDRIVAEFTGRPKFANDFYEICRRLLIFYNAKANYENNKKGIFNYFDQKRCLNLLCETPQILRDMDYVKSTGYGNKAHPYSEIVHTPNGIKKWGDIKIGDNLFGSYGNITKVIDIPFDDISDVYKITLKDGRSVKASENHLWSVVDWNDFDKILSTKELLKYYYRDKGKYREYKYYIKSNLGVDYKEKTVPIDPYFLGLMLGDGCFTQSKHHNANFTALIKDMDEYMKILKYDHITYDDRHHHVRFKNIGILLKSLNLHDKKREKKFIPNIYKYNSREVRLSLLKGLMDSDGTIGYGGNPEFANTSKFLCDGAMEIARSLGINCNLLYEENEYGPHYKVRFYTDIPIFNLKRKYSKQKITKTRAFKTAIVNIEKVGTERSKCVTVNSFDNCYLIGDYVTTHNSLGTNATAPINTWGRRLQRDWLMSPAYMQDIDDEGNQIGQKLNMHCVRSIAYLEELIGWNQDGNFDRVSAMGMLMIYREDRLKYIQQRDNKTHDDDYDEYIDKNFQNAYQGQNSYGSFVSPDW